MPGQNKTYCQDESGNCGKTIWQYRWPKEKTHSGATYSFFHSLVRAINETWSSKIHTCRARRYVYGVKVSVCLLIRSIFDFVSSHFLSFPRTFFLSLSSMSQKCMRSLISALDHDLFFLLIFLGRVRFHGNCRDSAVSEIKGTLL